MNEYRISKYNPQYRVDGKYTHNEWSSIADIGESFSEGILSEQECQMTIERYCKLIIDVLQCADIHQLKINNLEKYENHIIWENGQVVEINDIASVIKECLWENCWCRLTGDNVFIHFGYELYVYIGCSLSQDKIADLCLENNLFYEILQSPYKDQ